MSDKPRILVVEDEPAIRMGLLDVLVFHGFDVDYAETGDEGLVKALGGTFDMILLDVMLPGVNGFDICEQVRANDREQPIIMLTAKSDDEDVIHGLKLGADDYVAKPFSVAQLVLRIQAVLRRSNVNAENSDVIVLGDMRIDCLNFEGRRADVEISFTQREIEILRYLAANPERPVHRDELLARVWGYAKHMNIETRTVDIHIAKLRRKIEEDSSSPEFLVTVRGAGYRLLVGDGNGR